MRDFWINLQCLGHIYLKCFLETSKISRRYWWVLFTNFVYALILTAVAFAVRPLGLVGGFILALTIDACLSSFLVMVESMVRHQKITLEGFKKSFWVYFFDVVGVLFVYWLVDFLGMTPLYKSGNVWLAEGLRWTVIILFNPIPEVIYVAGVKSIGFLSLELYSKAYEFIRDNWVEWYVPNLLVIGLLYLLMRINWPLPGAASQLLTAMTIAFALYFLMIFRGLLFEALYRSSRRKRLFEYRAGRGAD